MRRRKNGDEYRDTRTSKYSNLLKGIEYVLTDRRGTTWKIDQSTVMEKLKRCGIPLVTRVTIRKYILFGGKKIKHFQVFLSTLYVTQELLFESVNLL